jgi:hypothetical protein
VLLASVRHCSVSLSSCSFVIPGFVHPGVLDDPHPAASATATTSHVHVRGD